ncbi:copper homeostasis protein CutC [Pelagibacterium halotolerans]|uniref:PF03932 family protein CutC n=1 Tax=Pelagibacterium halotolerans (strain DSM 22347 / JCM 15775 / CGMCC 1.7692 / B2) TaxID=1082931 RepID=G4R8M6_PELHB|nr:copper homeostasis protein CutC [Pelagibacterium halotolerans]AEQ50312.1 cytoplasmic copper homeostasis protein cutC [Pelagibacterium halotolerans B2]QJR19700.1 copper homeostasis protein CutC [Pelagibacterium halotolerans]SEA53278.1 copper homeostasis protein [Pelagibacterium halotolerans]
MTPSPTLEICVDDAAGLAAAIAGGADRIELCSALALGGLTPTPGLMALAAKAPIPVYAMIRPRPGDFVFSPDDVATMETDIDTARSAGLAGVVLGATRPDGSLDIATLEGLTARAAGLGLTLHRAFDLAPDFPAAIDTAIALGFERILTSGGAPRAIDGLDALRAMIAHAAGRIAIMPGSGVAADNARSFLALGATELHASAGRALEIPAGRAADLGYVAPGMKRTDADLVAALKRAMTAA